MASKAKEVRAATADTGGSKQPSEEHLQGLATPIRFLNGVGPKRAAQLEKFGLTTIGALLRHVPFRYEDRRLMKPIAAATPGEECSFIGEIAAVQKRYLPRQRRQILTAVLRDAGGALSLVWFRAPSYIIERIESADTLLVHGKVERGRGGLCQIVHPDFATLEAGDAEGRQSIVAIYERPTGLPLSALRKWLAEAWQQFGAGLQGCVPAPVLTKRHLMRLGDALHALHQPGNDAAIDPLNQYQTVAHRSVVFDELFGLQLGLALRRKCENDSAGLPCRRVEAGLTSKMAGLLPFKLTGAQRRVLGEIDGDMNGARPMQRLIQGDVGSGKTMVAWFASLRVIQHGFQALWMSPTELLAEQHFRGVQSYCETLGVKAALLTGSLSGKDKRAVLAGIECGEIQFVVGTHALIQANVRAPKMGLGVIDEQHRFGVYQRMSLQHLVRAEEAAGRMTSQPHMLLMSATPIPRSLAMVLYGDLDVSFLDEMPPGRSPIRTKVFGDRDRARMYQLVLEQIQAGHQAYIVYPLVAASEQLQQIRDATRMADELSNGAFRRHRVGLVHGRMASDERDAVMRRFRDGDVDILVATTVIEVGIDVPNATVIIIEHAERFGLAQLHQLRGRVGRGKAPGYCLLVNQMFSAEAMGRLRVMERSLDGFKIAEADMALRGPGELMGARQSGVADFQFANLARDAKLLMEARSDAQAWLAQDPELSSAESKCIYTELLQRWGQRLQLAAVG